MGLQLNYLQARLKNKCSRSEREDFTKNSLRNYARSLIS